MLDAAAEQPYAARRTNPASRPMNHPMRHLSSNRLSTLVSALIISCFATGCAGYHDDSARTIGEFTDDLGIQASVKTVLVRDDDINGLGINIEVSRSVVSLYGDVPSAAVRDKAISLAAGVRGVQKVEDHLTIVDPGS